jgi:inosine-uridine nucleoside N-ribohydrolase
MRLVLAALWCAPLMWSATSVWIDTDPSAIPGGHEVDDAFALLQAFGSPELSIRGISIVFGNADLPAASRIGRQIVKEFGPSSIHVFDGAGGASDLGRETKATLALADALRHGHLTILALGPATNIATVLRNNPELTANIDRIVAVAGRRPQQHFVAGPKQNIPFRDFNFELDPEAFRVILASKVPLTLAPWEISSKVWLTPGDIDALAARRPRFSSLLPAVRDWLALWRDQFGATGFNPFDTLAVGYVLAPSTLTCSAMNASIENAPDDTTSALGAQKPYLFVRPPGPGGRKVRYCHAAAPGFRKDLLARVAAGARQIRP